MSESECIDSTCSRQAVPGFDRCFWHANVEKMATKIVALTGQVGALQKEQEDAMALVKSYQADLIAAMQARDEARALAERYQAERGEALGVLADLQRSIASALFGAARDDDRCPPERITGSMIDALAPYLQAGGGEYGLLSDAEAFLAEEDRRGK